MAAPVAEYHCRPCTRNVPSKERDAHELVFHGGYRVATRSIDSADTSTDDETVTTCNGDYLATVEHPDRVPTFVQCPGCEHCTDEREQGAAKMRDRITKAGGVFNTLPTADDGEPF
jgi:hypothetical protein